eukprot:TRINITY_DN14052_c0_g1_i3.p1 TRINITY_DN14052_c0_g1~~TRINITY_DN14052_c0_g1_i3.p1  ORF type:complete len:416 (-),score=111.65 TRINITY_DN14052_c0_g1_i3:190-1437(-)
MCLIYVLALLVASFFFFFKQKTAYEMLRSLVGSEMCIRDRAQYLSYITGYHDEWTNSLIAACFCLVSMTLLYSDTSTVGTTTLVLSWGTVAAIAITLALGCAHFDSDNLGSPPSDIFQSSSYWLGFLAAARFGVYDFAGYYNCCYAGELLESPRSTIPRVVIGSAVGVSFVFAAVYLAIMGYLPWFGPGGFADKDSASYNHIMSSFYEKMFDARVGSAFTVLVAWTIFGSSFSMMFAYSNIPWAAAKDGYFFQFFAHSHPSQAGLADYSLLVLTAVSFLCCFLRLDTVIEGMLTTRLIVQFAAQSLGLLLLKPAPEQDGTFTVPCKPFTNVVTIIGFVTLFATTQNSLVSGNAPLLECSVGLIAAGLVVFVVWDSYFDRSGGEKSAPLMEIHQFEDPDKFEFLEKPESDAEYKFM